MTLFRKAIIFMIGALLSYIALFKPPLIDDTSFSRIILDRNSKLMRLTLSQDQKYRLYTPLEAIAPQFIEAVLLYEDRYFYQHVGINPIALSKAFIQTYISGSRKIGGSTITMQVSRLKFDIKSNNVFGKLWQIMKALQLEWHYSKHDILEAYLNLVPYGGNIEGVGAASYIYFGRNAQDLNLFESLSLAVIPQNPVKRSPSNKINNKIFLANKILFNYWLEQHPQDIIYSKLFDLPTKFGSIQNLPFTSPQFTLRMLATSNSNNITTTIDKDIQDYIARQVKIYINAAAIYGVRNAAALLMDFTTMEVLASIGSANFTNIDIQGQIDGTRVRRSPGSTLKPFIYALAFDQGLIHPLTLLQDAPYSYGNYLPENFDGDFIGPISAKDALIKSRNIPVLYLASRLERPTFYQFLKKAKINKLSSVDQYGLSIALGGAEVTMEELVKLYAMLANMGVYQELKKELNITRFTKVDTKEFCESRLCSRSNLRCAASLLNSSCLHPSESSYTQQTGNIRLLSPEASYITLDILKNIARPGLNSNMLGNTAINLPVYWKTGTSSSFRDGWAVGIFGKYVLAVWVGDFQGKAKGQFIGVKTAAPLFFNIIDSLANITVMKDLITNKLQELKITKVSVCADTGDIDNDICPIKTDSWFIPGKSPIKASNNYQKPEITSPLKNITYSLKTTKDITLSAITDTSVSTIFWFVDNKFIGKTLPSEALVWQATVGRKIVRAIDNNGYSHVRVIFVEN